MYAFKKPPPRSSSQTQLMKLMLTPLKEIYQLLQQYHKLLQICRK